MSFFPKGLFSWGSHDDDPPFPRSLDSGKYVSRGCTDKNWLVIFAVFMGGMVCEVAYAVSQGVNPHRLTHGVDFKGRVCGIDVPEEWVYWCGSAERSGAYPKRIMHEHTVCLKSCPIDASLRIPCLMPAVHNATSFKGGTLNLAGGVVNNMETLEIVITQSITYQQSYPSEPYAGKFCMPSRSPNSTLRDEIINGPYAWRYRAGAAFGSLRRAAPLLMVTALLAVIIGYLYLLILRFFAGLLIFIVMVLSVLLLTASSLFFLWAIFIAGEDEQSPYHHLNPIFRTYIGWEAKWSSILTGLVLLAASFLLGLIMCKSYEHIDEAVGVVAAACECLEKEASLMFLPLVQAALVIALIGVLLILGLPWVAAVGYLEKNDLSINGIEVDGLYWMWRRHWFHKVMIAYYLFGCWWVAEFFIAFGQFVVSYVVCLWYFQPVTEKESPLPLDIRQGIPYKPVRVRVTGVDDHYLPRQGLVVRSGEDKYLVAPVEDDRNFGPDELDTTEYEKPTVACAICKGVSTGLWNHMGSMAYGCLLIAVCRPFRMFSECLAGFVRQQEGITDEDEDGGDDDDGDGPPPESSGCSIDACITICSYLGVCMETIFGGYTKNTWTEIVLSGNEWKDAAESATEFMSQAGGSVAYLQGACFVYEVFGTLFITLVCVVTFVVVATKNDTFADPSSQWYIPNLYWGTLFATLIAGVTAFEFMQIFNHTADTLLYAFAWNRVLSGANEEFYPGRYCPGALRDMMQDYELEPGGPLELESEYTAADYIMRAGFEYPVRRLLTKPAFKSSSSASSGRYPSSRFFESECSIHSGFPSPKSALSRIEENERMEPGDSSARELSFRNRK